jgi:hypothetical protein
MMEMNPDDIFDGEESIHALADKIFALIKTETDDGIVAIAACATVIAIISFDNELEMDSVIERFRLTMKHVYGRLSKSG